MIGRRKVLIGAAAGLATASLPSAARAQRETPSGLSDAARRRVEELARHFLSTFNAVGVSLCYANNGRIVFAGGFGFADLRTREALHPQHRIRIASVSKPITATAIMMIRERGGLQLGQRIFGRGGLLNARFPLPNGVRNRAWLESITVDHLLTHSAGGWTNKSPDPMFRHRDDSMDWLIVKTLVEVPLVEPPGTRSAYSNFGYCLLGRVIEAVSGMPYASFVRQELLLPAGAQSFAIGHNRRANRLPGEVAYHQMEKPDQPYSINVTRMDAHGGWVATPSDLVRFALAVDGRPSARHAVSAESIAMMTSPSATTRTYGRGWAINPSHGNYWHNGLLPGSLSFLVCAADGWCFCGLVNAQSWKRPETQGALEKLLWQAQRALLT